MQLLNSIFDSFIIEALIIQLWLESWIYISQTIITTQVIEIEGSKYDAQYSYNDSNKNQNLWLLYLWHIQTLEISASN